MSLDAVVNAVVCLKSDEYRENPGVVYRLGDAGSGLVGVRWRGKEKVEFVQAEQLTSGLHESVEVMHKPRSPIQPGLGWGVVRGYRMVAGQGQNLVEFPEDDRRLWLPWQRLAMIRGVKNRVRTGRLEAGDDADRMRLRILSRAIELWNENTGSLATFDIDPLPHQIQLVHHILGSGHLNWLIADDVGLGKTIEVGLLLSALRQQGRAGRVLLVTPAGITRQWKEELDGKFGLNGFRIYGDQFNIEEPREWAMYKQVIASMDRLRNEDHLEKLMLGDPWDLVIVDEAHRLSRSDEGTWQQETLRYRMARLLRKKAESMVLLSATPHQGRTDRFAALLELLHPERRREFRMLDVHPEILSEMVFRNRKADVTNMDGMPVFKGKETRRVEVPTSLEVKEFDRALRRYLHHGYDAQARAAGNTGRAIGFVMTVYRKLAASSLAAIHSALRRRLQRLTAPEYSLDVAESEEDERFQGESEERKAAEYREEFFDREIELLEELLAQSGELLDADPKLHAFLNRFLEGFLANDPSEKLLIFTEYKATQEWIMKGLTARFGSDSVDMINGDIKPQDRREIIHSFDDPDGLQFLVSTEAGGEGINLHRHCHVMVNYDLPWNPMRLVQRVGRLYRYGQEKKVLVFNLHQPDTADEHVLDTMYDRLDRVARDLCTFDEQEFNEAMKDDILGELSDLVDVEDILAEAGAHDRHWADERIEEALERAREATRLQNDLFRHAAGYDPNELRSSIQVNASHLQALAEGMASHSGYEILERTHGGVIWEIRLSEATADRIGLSRRRWKIGFDRDLAASRKDVMHMNMDSWLLRDLLAQAGRPQFKGLASLSSSLPCEGIVAGIARWISPRGQRLKQQLAVLTSENGDTRVNSEWTGEWLKHAIPEEPGFDSDSQVQNQIFSRAEEKLESLLGAESDEAKLPDAPQWIAVSFGR